MSAKNLICAETFALKSCRTVRIPTDAALQVLTNADPKLSAGSFTYDGGRFLLWRCSGASVQLEDHSVDAHLSENCIAIQFGGSRIVPGCNAFVSTGGMLVFVVPTVSDVHRFYFMHDMNELHRCSSTRSILSAFPDTDQLAKYHDEHSISTTNRGAAVVRVSIAQLADGRTRCAVCLEDGSLLVITMPIFGDKMHYQSTEHILGHGGIVDRLLRYSRQEDGIVDAIVTNDGDSDTFIYGIYRDAKLRMWSCTTLQMKCTTIVCPKAMMIQSSTQSIRVESVIIRSCILYHKLLLIVNMKIASFNTFIILSPMPNRNSIIELLQIAAPNMDLIDFALTPHTNTSVVLHAVWTDENKNTNCKRKLITTNNNILGHSRWQSIDYYCDKRSISSNKKSCVFNGDRFSFDTVHRALTVTCRSYPISVCFGDWSALMAQIDSYFASNEFESQYMSKVKSGDPQSLMKTAESKFWNNVIDSCEQLHQKSQQPIALLSSSSTHLNGIIDSDRFTFFFDVDDKFDSNDDDDTDDDLHECMTKAGQLCPIIDNTVAVSWNRIETMINDVVERNSAEYRLLMQQLDGCTNGIDARITAIINAIKFEPITINVDDDNCSTSSYMATGALASGLLSMATVVTCRHRLDTCDNLILLLGFISRLQMDDTQRLWMKGDAVAQLLVLRLHYLTLYTILSTRILPGAEMRSRSLGESFRPTGGSFSIAYAIYQSSIGDRLKRIAVSTEHATMPFGSFVRRCVAVALYALSPQCPNLFICEFLNTHGYHSELLNYCEMLKPWPLSLRYVLCHYEAISFANLNRPIEALDKFMHVLDAFKQFDARLHYAIFHDENEHEFAVSCYLIKVMGIFEECGHKKQMLETAREALRRAHPSDPNIPTFYTTQFKHEIDNGRYMEAVMMIMQNPASDSRTTCLRVLLMRLIDDNRIDALIDIDFGELTPQLVELMDAHARVMDVSRDSGYDCYQQLFAFHACRSNFRRAAMVMYELASRLRNESFGSAALKKRCRALAVAEQTLLLAHKHHQYLVYPTVGETAENSVSMIIDNDEGSNNYQHLSTSQQPQVVQLDDMRREYIIATSRLMVHDGDETLAIANLPSDPIDLVRRLIEPEQHFDQALTLCRTLDVDASVVYDLLTSKCIHLDAHETDVSAESLDNNSMLRSHGENSRGAWTLLRAYINHGIAFDSGDSRMLHAVTNRMLSLRYPVPLWLSTQHMKRDFGDYLRLLIDYGRLYDAQSALIDYLDKMSQQLSSAVPTHVWLPYAAIDQLLMLSRAADTTTTLNTKQFEVQLHKYLQQADAFSTSVGLYRRVATNN